MRDNAPMTRNLLLAFVIVLLAPLSARADPNALWKIVHGTCVPHVLAHAGPAPCASVDLADHFALLKDQRGATQYLLIPTDRITGIESPLLLAPNTPNFWAFAWAARSDVIAKAPRKLSPDEVGLAINPPWGRTQNQLHIHVDCVKSTVSARLSEVSLGDTWVPIYLAGVAYQARNFDMTENPFEIMAPEALRQHTVLGDWSLATVGPHILLATRSAPAENLLDHDCRR